MFGPAKLEAGKGRDMPERHGCPDPTLARSGDLALILAVPRQRKQDIDDLPKARRLSAGKGGTRVRLLIGSRHPSYSNL